MLINFSHVYAQSADRGSSSSHAEHATKMNHGIWNPSTIKQVKFVTSRWSRVIRYNCEWTGLTWCNSADYSTQKVRFCTTRAPLQLVQKLVVQCMSILSGLSEKKFFKVWRLVLVNIFLRFDYKHSSDIDIALQCGFPLPGSDLSGTTRLFPTKDKSK